jgi:hypothetical protein
MSMGCESCLPLLRTYTVYFSKDKVSEPLKVYFDKFPEVKWHLINDRIMLMEELVFFDLLDYLNVHVVEGVYASICSDKSDPIGDLQNMKH